jgi:hypothetical protein
MNRRLASVLSWLDSLCMAAEKMKTVDVAAARSRISEWPGEDTASYALHYRSHRTEIITFFDLAGLDYSVLRDMDAVVSYGLTPICVYLSVQLLTEGLVVKQRRRRMCWEAVNSRTETWGSPKLCNSTLNSPLFATASVLPAAAATSHQRQLCTDCNPSAASVLHFNSSQQG